MAENAKVALTKLNATVAVVEPLETVGVPPTEVTSTQSPKVILLATWMEAQQKHINKYILAYQLLYPTASILLVKSFSKHFAVSRRGHRQTLVPAQAFLTSRLPPNTVAGPKSDLLVHVFSNGGCANIEQLNLLFTDNKKKKNGTIPEDRKPLLKTDANGIPARAFVFDSSPGGADLKRTIAAFTAPLRAWWIRWPASTLIAIIYCVWKSFGILTRSLPPPVRTANYLNSSMPPVPRLYLYSDKDKLILDSEVEAHAKQAKSNGVDVTLEKFVGTNHVNHVVGEGNKERYWAAVKKLWLDAGRE